MIAKMTQKVAGLNRCLSRNRKSDFEEIAAAAAIGCAIRLSARNSSDRLRQVMKALRIERGFEGVSVQHAVCISRPAAKVSTTCAGRIEKSRKYAPAASRMPREKIWKRRGSANEPANRLSFELNASIESSSRLFERATPIFLQVFQKLPPPEVVGEERETDVALDCGIRMHLA